MAPTCKLCYEVFAPGQKAPLVISCGHTTCKSCLESLLDNTGEIKCPTCRQIHNGDSIDNLPINYDLLDHATEEPVTPIQQQAQMNVIVKNLDGKQFRVQVSPNAHVAQIKEELAGSYGLSVNNISLMLHGRRLQDEKTVADSGIMEGSVLEMTTRYEGGDSGRLQL